MARKYGPTFVAGKRRTLHREASLADAGLATNQDAGTLTAGRSCHGTLDHCKLSFTADEAVGPWTMNERLH